MIQPAAPIKSAITSGIWVLPLWFICRAKNGVMPTLGVDERPLCLHAWKIFCTHPLTKLLVEFTALPSDWVRNISSEQIL